MSCWQLVTDAKKLSSVRTSRRGEAYEEIVWGVRLGCSHYTEVVTTYVDAIGDSAVAPHLPPGREKCPKGCASPAPPGDSLWPVALVMLIGLALLGLALIFFS